MRKALQLWHVGTNSKGEETVLQSSAFGKELQEFRLQADETVLVRTGDHTDLLVVCCRQTVPTEEITRTLEAMIRLVSDLMPGVKDIALPDYALLNDAPIAARNLIDRLKR